jgi:glycosyltransferase involved in cell wall biosynthesis
LERRAAAFTDILIAVSRENRQAGLAAGIGREGQYRVLHSGIDPRTYRPGAPAARGERGLPGSVRRPTVLVLSNFKKQKSPMDVVETAALLARLSPGVLFRWAGDGPLFRRVERAVGLRGLRRNFELLGWRDDVARLLHGADALLLTSLHEGLPRVVLQAMAAEKPVVATAVSGTPEAVKQGVTGFLRQPHDARGMAEDLYHILKDPALARRMGKAGRQALKGTFLIDRMLHEIEGLYAELLARHPV